MILAHNAFAPVNARVPSISVAESRSGPHGFKAPKVVVVGGGVGGLAVGGRLAKQGFDVEILEKNTEVGGRMQSLILDADLLQPVQNAQVCQSSFRFDTGPSLLLLPQRYRETFAALGEEMDDHVSLKRVEPAAYRVFFAEKDGPYFLDLLYDVQAMCSQLEHVEKGASANYLRFLSDAKEALDKGMENFIARDFHSFWEYADFFRLLPLLKRLSPFQLLRQHNAQMGHYFKCQKLRALFTFQDLYVGLSPYNAPGVFSLLPGTELTDGVWYPIGGFGQIRDGITRAAQNCGVKIQTKVEVESINCRNGKVVSVSLQDGSILEADIVVANADLPYVCNHLLNGDYSSRHTKRLSKSIYSAGIIAFNWALGTYVDGLCHHNVFLSDSYQRSWDRAKDSASLLEKPNFYIHAPTRTDTSSAPTGKDALTILLPVANLEEGYRDDGALVDAARTAILARLKQAGLGNLGPNIVSEIVYAPPDWQQMYNLHNGAAFGLAHNFFQLAYFRPDIADPSVKGLYYVGASTRPGNGVPLVLLGAKTTANRIMENYSLLGNL